MIKKITGLLTAVALMLGGCSIDGIENKELSYSKQIFSKDCQYVIETPVDWESQDISVSGCTMQAYCRKRQIYFFAVTEEIVISDYVPLETFCETCFQALNKNFIDNYSAHDMSDITVNGNPAKYLEIHNPVLREKGVGDIDKSAVFLYAIQADDYFVMCEFITLEEDSAQRKDEVETIINSFSKYNT